MIPPSRKDLKREYKEKPRVAGVFQIKNKVTGKLFLGSSLNIDGPLNAHKFMLSNGSHRNTTMQKDYKKFGEDAFSFDILATVVVMDIPGFNLENELEILEELWLDELQQEGEMGYNRNQKIRQV